MSTLGTLAVVGIPAFIKGTQDAKTLQVKYMRGEMKRGAQRIRKSFIRTQLQGAPGIKAGKLAKGKNVFTFVGGSDPTRIYAKVGISRILHVHEKGLTITPTKGQYLAITENRGTSREKIVALVPKVVIPARLKFQQQVEREAPRELRKVAEAAARATEVAMTKALKQVGRLT